MSAKPSDREIVLSRTYDAPCDLVIDDLEIVKPERLNYSHGDDGAGTQPPFDVTLGFAEQDGKATVPMRALFVTAGENNRLLPFSIIEGGQQTLARLAEHLAKL